MTSVTSASTVHRFHSRSGERSGWRRPWWRVCWPGSGRSALAARCRFGGDVTQFFIGLMGFLGESLRAGRLPVWNDLWGYGFPGLARARWGSSTLFTWFFIGAEHRDGLRCQPGAPHALGRPGSILGCAPAGYLSAGSALAAFAWSACGFFRDSPGPPVGLHDRMLDALGLGPDVVLPRSTGGCYRPAAPFLLSLVLVLQVLPGHFQLAFMTQFGDRSDRRLVGRRALGTAVCRGAPPSTSAPLVSACAERRELRLALAVAFPLAAVQLWPTARLAGLAAGQRDFEYLSGFASTPFHLVNFVAPGLFHRSPLWRPLVWDPFHTSPEEHLPTSGWFPSFWRSWPFAASGAATRPSGCWRSSCVVTLVLEPGPLCPGFGS